MVFDVGDLRHRQFSVRVTAGDVVFCQQPAVYSSATLSARNNFSLDVQLLTSHSGPVEYTWRRQGARRELLGCKWWRAFRGREADLLAYATPRPVFLSIPATHKCKSLPLGDPQ